MTSERIAKLCETAEKREALMEQICGRCIETSRCEQEELEELCDICPVKPMLDKLILAERTAAVSTAMLITAEEMTGKRQTGKAAAPCGGGTDNEIL